MRSLVLNDALKILVTAGLGIGYIIIVRTNIRDGQKSSAIANTILLPTSLIWLWLISDDAGEK